MRIWLRHVAAAVCHLLVWCYLCPAQEVGSAPASPAVVAAPTSTTAPPSAAAPVAEAADAPTASPQPPPLRLEETRPDIYYLPDKQGKLQPVLDFKYQDFVDLYKLKNQLDRRDRPPRYSLQRVSATGKARSEYVELSCQFQVLVRDDDWVRVPLRLEQGLLQGEVKYRGAGEQFIHFESETDGYVCWVRGKANTQHEITLAILVPLSLVGEETLLRLHVPRATASEFKLTVPATGVVAKAPDGVTLLPPVEKDDATELTAIGLAGDFQLSWRKPNATAANLPEMLESVGSILVKMENRFISSEATLTVRSYGAGFDRFRVRLPPEAEFSAVNGSRSGYTVTPVDSSDPPRNAQGGGSRLVEVRLAKKTVGPVEVRLSGSRPYDPTSGPSWCELAGFEVVGTTRQWGTIAVIASDFWQVLWGPSGETNQIEQTPESLRRDNVVACFEYASPSFSLNARLVPRKTRISVEPEYLMLIDRDETRLNGRLSYTIHGAKVAALQLAMPGWELDEIGPESLAAIDGLTVDREGVATIPLTQPCSGKIELRISARRPIRSGTASLSIPLPQPLATTTSPAMVAVVPADNIEIIPNAVVIEGLVRQRSAPRMELPERQQEALFYRSTGAAAVFAADLRYHSQQVTVDVGSELILGEHAVAVEQEFAYRIAYEPVDHFMIAVPRSLAEGNRVEFLQDGKALTAAVEIDRLQRHFSATLPMRITLPQPQIGPCKIVIRYTEPLPDAALREKATTTVPLSMPMDGEITDNRVYLNTGANVQASPSQGAWTVAESAARRAGHRNELLLTAVGRVGEIAFDIRREDATNANATFVDRAWVQSRLTSTARQDRAVWNVVTRQKELEMILPAGAAVKELSLTLDGTPIACRSRSENRLLISLADDGRQHRYVLEMQYHFAGARPPQGLLNLELPRLGANVWTRQMYWQLVLPSNEHVVAVPDGFTNECRWTWNGGAWQRQPLLDQTQLESWVGVAPQSMFSENGGYLYAAMGTVERAELHTAGRAWLVLLASGAALIVGLALIYVPACRHPAVLLVLALGLLGAGAILPEPMFLMIQASSLGLALTLLAGFLRRAFVRPRVATIAEISHSRVELGSTRLPFQPPTVGNTLSTQTLPTNSAPDIQT